MENEQEVMAPTEAGKSEKRTPRSVRFHDPEWERIEEFAEKRGMARRGVRPLRRARSNRGRRDG